MAEPRGSNPRLNTTHEVLITPFGLPVFSPEEKGTVRKFGCECAALFLNLDLSMRLNSLAYFRLDLKLDTRLNRPDPTQELSPFA